MKEKPYDKNARYNNDNPPPKTREVLRFQWLPKTLKGRFKWMQPVVVLKELVWVSFPTGDINAIGFDYIDSEFLD